VRAACGASIDCARDGRCRVRVCAAGAGLSIDWARKHLEDVGRDFRRHERVDRQIGAERLLDARKQLRADPTVEAEIALEFGIGGDGRTRRAACGSVAVRLYTVKLVVDRANDVQHPDLRVLEPTRVGIDLRRCQRVLHLYRDQEIGSAVRRASKRLRRVANPFACSHLRRARRPQ
jgi:hypothetical protein